METVDLRTDGMHCPSCSMLIEMTVGDLAGVSKVEADYRKGTACVDFDPAVVTAQEIIGAIEEAGYTAGVL